MSEQADFLPQWVSPPGDTISDILTQREIPLEQFATMMELDNSTAQELLNARMVITDEIAIKLEICLGGSKLFWMQREEHYRQDCQRLGHSLTR
jgi:HTH-type transcriptional regulator / antitoxin HigA